MTPHEKLLTAVAAVQLIIVIIYGLARRFLRWECRDGYIHWREECTGHEPMRLVRETGQVVVPEDPPMAGKPDWPAVDAQGLLADDYGPGSLLGETALDDRWATKLHDMNTELRAVLCPCCGKRIDDNETVRLGADAPFCWTCGLYVGDDPARCDKHGGLRESRERLDADPDWHALIWGGSWIERSRRELWNRARLEEQRAKAWQEEFAASDGAELAKHYEYLAAWRASVGLAA